MVLDKIASLRYFISNLIFNCIYIYIYKFLMVKGGNNMIGAGGKGTSGYVPLCLIFKTLKTMAVRQREESLKATVYLPPPIS
jgi:hypothetical protein